MGPLLHFTKKDTYQNAQAYWCHLVIKSLKRLPGSSQQNRHGSTTYQFSSSLNHPVVKTFCCEKQLIFCRLHAFDIFCPSRFYLQIFNFKSHGIKSLGQSPTYCKPKFWLKPTRPSLYFFHEASFSGGMSPVKNRLRNSWLYVSRIV